MVGPLTLLVAALAGAVLVRLGRISYSLFLVHFPVLLLVSAAAVRWWPVGAWFDVAGLAAAFGLSLLAAIAMHRWVEQRAPGWRLTLSLFGGLLACGLLANSL